MFWRVSPIKLVTAAIRHSYTFLYYNNRTVYVQCTTQHCKRYNTFQTHPIQHSTYHAPHNKVTPHTMMCHQAVDSKTPFHTHHFATSNIRRTAYHIIYTILHTAYHILHTILHTAYHIQYTIYAIVTPVALTIINLSTPLCSLPTPSPLSMRWPCRENFYSGEVEVKYFFLLQER